MDVFCFGWPKSKCIGLSLLIPCVAASVSVLCIDALSSSPSTLTSNFNMFKKNTLQACLVSTSASNRPYVGASCLLPPVVLGRKTCPGGRYVVSVSLQGHEQDVHRRDMCSRAVRTAEVSVGHSSLSRAVTCPHHHTASMVCRRAVRPWHLWRSWEHRDPGFVLHVPDHNQMSQPFMHLSLEWQPSRTALKVYSSYDGTCTLQSPCRH